VISTLQGAWGLKRQVIHGLACSCRACTERRRLRDLRRAEAVVGTLDRISRANLLRTLRRFA
jgi:hypothetical protein